MIAYLSHTLGSSNGIDSVRRQDNIANAISWLDFLVMHTTWAITLPWLPFVMTEHGAREVHRPRGFADQIRILQRCDAIVLVGGIISPHMNHEIDIARRGHIAIVDLSDLGRHPPDSEVTDNAFRALLADRAPRCARRACQRAVGVRAGRRARVSLLGMPTNDETKKPDVAGNAPGTSPETRKPDVVAASAKAVEPSRAEAAKPAAPVARVMRTDTPARPSMKAAAPKKGGSKPPWKGGHWRHFHPWK
jgi:hypothetical protein